MPEITPSPQLSLQESAIASDMLHGSIGSAVLNFTVRNGVRTHDEMYHESNFANLTERFRKNPKDSLAIGREDIFAIAGDDSIAPSERASRTSRYIDAYLSLTVKLDRAAFPPTKDGMVQKDVPNYLPDGFVDMGSDASADTKKRSREQIVLDKSEIFKIYRSEIQEIFTDERIINADNDMRKRLIASYLAQKIYYKMPYDHQEVNTRIVTKNNVLSLSELDKGLCRHHAMAFQTLAQLFGLTTRLLKNTQSVQEENGSWTARGPHVVNLVRINGEWKLVDVTQPDTATIDGVGYWAPGTILIDRPPYEGEVKEYVGAQKHKGKVKKYVSRSNSYWRIVDLRK